MSDNVQLSDIIFIIYYVTVIIIFRNLIIKLTRLNVSENMHRFYVLQLGLTLFGEWVLLAEWGRIGSPGRVKEEAFPFLGHVQAALSKRLSAKIRRGYSVTSA
jgi:predicted DNA-binding WGR domain protein